MSTLIARSMQTEDQDGLIELFEEVFGHTVTPWMWAWKYMPPWASKPHCWVGIYEEKVIGYFGAVPGRGFVDGQEVPFFQFADFMVHPDYRRKFDYFTLGLKAVLEDLGAAYSKYMIYGFSDHRAFLGFRRSKTAELLEKATTCYLRAGEEPVDSSLQVRDLAFDAPQIDRLWKQKCDDYPMGLIRDGQYLNWRYGRHPVYRYRCLGLWQNDELCGWMIIGNDGPGKNGRAKEYPVVDFLLAPELIRPGLAALRAFLDHDVMAWLPHRLMGDWPDKKETGTHVYHFCKQASFDSDRVRQDLFYTMGDVDWW